MLTDTHCHLYYKDLKKDLQGVFDRANKLGVNRFICAATNMEDVHQCIEIAENYDQVFCSSGIHPHDTKDAPKNYIEKIYNLMSNDNMVAIGEIGLDYYRNISDSNIQKKRLREQLKIALEIDKPVIIHNREADEDMISILTEFPEISGVAHCFSSNLDMANQLLELGYYISFSGNLTFKNSHLPSIAKELPLDRLLVETDSPFLSPVPFRGKPNEPARVRYVAEKLAEIHNIALEEIANITSDNASKIFRL
jgi:TatD DNase family protein